MLYAIFKTVHLLSVVAWIGGMFFVLACLRPALVVIEGPARLALMQAVMGRFFAIVQGAIGLILLSGIAMLWIVHGATGTLAHLPHAWMLMIALGLVMMGLFEFVRGSLFKRMRNALVAKDPAAAIAAMGRIRSAVLLNLVLGVVVVVAMKLGSAA